MSITMLQHFDYPETLSYEGNAELSDASKFGKACAHFKNSKSKVSISNTTGVFNLSASGNEEAECFVKVGQSASIDVEAQMEEELLDEGYHIFDGHVFKAITDTKTWEDAKLYCEALGGHLATSTSAEKNTFLTTLIETNWVSIGGQKIDDAWTWITGETWDYTNWRSNSPSNGQMEICLYVNTSGEWDDDTPSYSTAYICEWDYDIQEPKTLTLSITNDGELNLKSAIWGLDETSTLTLEADTWHHVLLRLSSGTASVYLDGVQALSGSVSGEDITPEALILGGYTGYIDEFVFRDEAGTCAPTVPTSAYETGSGTAPTTSNAPVTRAVWSCEDLPEGLTLSNSGVLSGHPTTAGTYNCNVQVATNWGTANKVIKITVSE